MIRFTCKMALVGLGAAALAGCTAEPRYPIDPSQPLGQGGIAVAQPRYSLNPQPAVAPSPQPPPPQATPNADDDEGAPPRAAPMRPIATQTLGAPGTSPPPEPPIGEDAGLRGRQSSSGSYARPAPTPALETPRDVQVQPFENLYDLAERTRTPIRAIIDANNLRPPYTLVPGSVLRIPSPAVYTVAEGDTLFGVARRFSIDPQSLANLNDIPLETRVRSGQRLALPSLVHDKGPIAGAHGVRPEGLGEETAQAPPREARTPSHINWAKASAATNPGAHSQETLASTGEPEPPPRVETPAASDSDIASLGKGKFVWPVRGEILSTFGPKGPGQRNDGGNIAAAAGEIVKASAAGVVVYAGASIPAFGNLVLVKHPGGWATLYGNLGKITVRDNAEVAQGQQIGVAGVSGAVDRAQVHFEIRYSPNPKDKAKPYDPVTLLPGG
jgi:murein DD-endopeptidase MepM/ murein hydrolase activator NlpD